MVSARVTSGMSVVPVPQHLRVYQLNQGTLDRTGVLVTLSQ